MKKLIFTLFICSFAFYTTTFAQNFDIEKGTTFINIGVGIGSPYSYNVVGLGGGPGFGVVANFDVSLFPIGDDVGIIGIGALGGFSTASGDFTSNSSYRRNTIGFGPRVTFHMLFIPVEKIDVYAGVQGMFRLTSYSDYYGNNFDVDANAIVGIHYYVTEKFLAFAELGYSFTYFTVGLTFKL